MTDGEPPLARYGDMVFVRVCPVCNRFVKADEGINFLTNMNDDVKFNEPNATCKKHGRVNMPFEGYV